MSTGERALAWLGLAMIAAALWVGVATTQGRWHQRLFVAAWIVSALLLLAGIAVIVLSMTKRKDEPEPRGPTGIEITPEATDNIFHDIHISGMDPAIRNEGKRNRFSKVQIRGSGETSSEEESSQETKGRKSWSFPEMPWKRSKPNDPET